MRVWASDKRVVIAAAVAAVLAVSVAVVQLSAAAFVATTENTGNSWATGEVVLDDNSTGNAMFEATGLVPGDAVERCITVDYAGDVAADVALYGKDLTGDATLADDLLVSVHSGAGNAGTAGTFGDCENFVADTTHLGTPKSLTAFAGDHTDFASGLGDWSPDAAEVRTYRITVALDGGSDAQGQTAGYTFVWEARSR